VRVVEILREGSAFTEIINTEVVRSVYNSGHWIRN